MMQKPRVEAIYFILKFSCTVLILTFSPLSMFAWDHNVINRTLLLPNSNALLGVPSIVRQAPRPCLLARL